MPAPKVNGFSVAYTAFGGILLWSGIKGTTLSTTFRDLLHGQAPTQDQQQVGSPTLNVAQGNASAPTASAAPGDTGAASASAKANQAIGRLLAAPYGWSTGQQWADLVSLWNRESGWSASATNPQSGAFGIAQALGHGSPSSAGTAVIDGSTHNEYPSAAANNGSATAQISWGLSYIRQTYGDPVNAWAHEESAGWY